MGRPILATKSLNIPDRVQTGRVEKKKPEIKREIEANIQCCK